MVLCSLCKAKPSARVLKVCADCLRASSPEEASALHPFSIRSQFRLPLLPPRSSGGRPCSLCSNQCLLSSDEKGYCGLRKNVNGKVKTIVASRSALAHQYLDPLPTNCCAAWFCDGSRERGYNLAFFFYGCNFNCLFCQNWSHKNLKEASVVTEEEALQAALSPSVRCICFFGGSPEPQLPFALKLSQRIRQESNNTKHICWEWNGGGNLALVKKAAELSYRSGGTVKFDLKAFHPNIARALCGSELSRSYENFQLLSRLFPRPNFLTATTLLVPYYVDASEVREISLFLSQLSPEIPYSLLVFHPDFYLNDLPVTPRKQVEECYGEAKRYLRNVHVGNIHLL